MLGVNTKLIRIDVFKHEKERVVGDPVTLGEINHALLFLFEIMRKEGFEVERSTGEDHLVAVDGIAIYDERDIRKVGLIQHSKEVLWRSYRLIWC